MKIPLENKWLQINDSEIGGSLFASKNIDLTQEHELRISPRMVLATDSSNLPNLGVPCVFRYFPTSLSDGSVLHSTTYLCVAGSRLFFLKENGLNGEWVQDGTNFSPNNLSSESSDMEIFDSNSLYITGATTSLYKLSSGLWTELTSRLTTSGGLHSMAYLRSTQRLYFVDNNSKSVGSIDKNDVAATLGETYTLHNIFGGVVGGVGSYISWIRATSNRVWVGTINSADEGLILEWDGIIGNTPIKTYKLGVNGSLSAIVADDVLYVIDTEGSLLFFNGGTFVKIASLPTNQRLLGIFNTVPTLRPVHYNGMSIIDGEICVLVNTSLYETGFRKSTNLDRLPAGIWAYSKKNGFYHKNSISLSKANEAKDFGCSKLSRVGALFVAKNRIDESIATVGSQNGTYVCGARFYSTDSEQNGIFYDDSKNTLKKSGYFVTQKLYSDGFKDAFNKILCRFDGLDGRIVVKYRTIKDIPKECEVSITGNDSFVTSADLSDYSVGDEVEFLSGEGSGLIGDITQIIYQDGNYHVLIDNSLIGITGESIVRLQKWKKAGTSEEVNSLKFQIGKISNLIQLKIIIETEGDFRFFDLNLLNSIKEL